MVSEILAGPVSLLLGIFGYVIVLKYLDPLVIGVVMLSEPAVGTAMGMHPGTLPLLMYV